MKTIVQKYENDSISTKIEYENNNVKRSISVTVS